MRIKKHIHSFNSFIINESLQEQGVDATPELIETVKNHVNLLIYGDKTGTEGILIRKADTGRTEQELQKEETVKEEQRKAKVAEGNSDSPTLAEDWRFNIFKLLQKIRAERGDKIGEMFFTRATGSDVLPWADAQVIRWGLLLLAGEDDEAKRYKKNTDEQYRFTATEYSVKGKGDLIFSGEDGDAGFPEFAVAKASKADWLHRFDESEVKKMDDFESDKEIWYLGGEQVNLPFDVTISFFEKSSNKKVYQEEPKAEIKPAQAEGAEEQPKSTYVPKEEAQEMEKETVEPMKKGTYKPVDVFGNFEIVFQINYYPKDTITNETGETYEQGAQEEGQEEEGQESQEAAVKPEVQGDDFKEEGGVPTPIKRRGKGADNFGGAF